MIAHSENQNQKNQKQIEAIKKYGLKGKGRADLIRHLEGKRLTQAEAIRAYCYDCQGDYADGIADCENPACPLYPYHPYNKTHRSPRIGRPLAEKKSLASSGEYGSCADNARTAPARNKGAGS
ncbi:MAG: hypothetical protein A4E38_00001 [Methanoregulaceae archaeon PtaB.Bin108]|nr:MAG: hypothetical protein A4E38_00001 [Methanoregulaceae archaeon PtaB.Bin108]